MFKRHIMRAKVLQSLYGSDCNSIKNRELLCKESLALYGILIKETEKMIFCFIDLLCQLCDYSSVIALSEKNKKLVENIKPYKTKTTLADSLINTSFKNFFKKHKEENKNNLFKKVDNIDLIHNMFFALLECPQYIKYLDDYDNSTDKLSLEVNIMVFIFQNIIMQSKTLEQYIEDAYLNSFEDASMVVDFIIDNIKKFPQCDFDVLNIYNENIELGRQLIKIFYDKTDYLLVLISSEIKHWQSDRIVVIDMIILKLALIEILYFDNIPIKVSLDEYIELSKEYSTSGSKQFINGVLDTIQKKLVKEGKLLKKV